MKPDKDIEHIETLHTRVKAAMLDDPESRSAAILAAFGGIAATLFEGKSQRQSIHGPRL